LRPLNPVRAELNRKLAPWRTKRGTVHATTELVARFDYDEVCDSLFRQLARCDNACNAAPKDEHLFGFWCQGVDICVVAWMTGRDGQC
jgi:hypothetical protein